jgi:hypothetical protein
MRSWSISSFVGCSLIDAQQKQKIVRAVYVVCLSKILGNASGSWSKKGSVFVQRWQIQIREPDANQRKQESSSLHMRLPGARNEANSDLN